MQRPAVLMVIHLATITLVSFGARATAEDEDPHRPGAIVTTEIPVVPPEIFDRLNQYQSVRSASFMGWDPGGAGMMIQTQFGNAVQLHRVYEPGGRREQITFMPEPVGGKFIAAAADGAVLLVMSEGGDENYQIYVLDRASGRTTLLTDGESRNRLGPILPDGSKMIVHSNARNGRDTDVYVADCREPSSMELLYAADGKYWVATDWSPDGAQLLMLNYVSINESYPALVDVAEHKLEPLPMPGDAKMAFGSLAFAPDGKNILVTSDAPGEFHQLGRFDPRSGEYTWLTADVNWDVSELEVDVEHGLIAFTTNEDGASRLFLLEGDRHRPLDVPLGIIDGLEFSPDGAQLGFTLSRPDAPADAYSLRLADGEIVRWTYSEVGGLDASAFVRPERIRFTTFDGRETPAYYYRPPGSSDQNPAPVLIDIHGGPEGQYRPRFSGITQYMLNELGIAVLAPNVRGSDGYGKTYLTLDNGPLREDSVRDIGALLDWIAERPELDAGRVAVAGGSYGGYMVLASLVMHGDRIQAGIDRVGIASFISFLERTSPYRQDLRRAEYGDERDPEMRQVFARIDPVSNAHRIRSALLVAHGINDPRVPFFEAEQIVEKVRANGRTVWTVYADNEGHGFAKKDNRDYLTAVETLFLQRHLLE